MNDKRNDTGTGVTLRHGDMAAMSRVVQAYKERNAAHLLFAYVGEILKYEPWDIFGLWDFEKLAVDFAITGEGGDCSRLGPSLLGEDRTGYIVIDNQTKDTICFQVIKSGTPEKVCLGGGLPCVFDLDAASSEVDLMPDGHICIPPGVSTIPIADDAPEGSYDLSFGCLDNGGGPRLKIPPPKV